MGKLLLLKSMDAFCGRKGAEHAVDHICHSRNFVATGIDQWVHDGWSYSLPLGHRHRCGGDPGYSGTKMILSISTPAGEGEVLGKEVASRSRKILSNLRTLQ